MFIHYLRQTSLLLLSVVLANNTFAEVYKWANEQGEAHYSQLPPKGQNAELIKAPSVIDSSTAQQAIDRLISQQIEDRKLRLQQQNKAKQAAKQKALHRKNCSTAKHNLQKYHDNPGRRFMDADGNVTRLKEEERQQKINESQQIVHKYCK